MEMRWPLTAGQVTAGCTAYGLIAVLQPHYELVAAAFLRGVNDLRIGRTLSAHADIVHDRKVKEVVVLRHIGDVLRALRQRQRANVHAAQVDFSVLHIPQEAMSRAMVDFPLPEGPTNALTVPGAMCRSIPCSTSLS